MSNTFCCVFGCNSLARRDTSVSFHKFPPAKKYQVPIVNKRGILEKIDLKLAWELKLKMGKKVTERMVVCSKHFLPEDYLPTWKGNKKIFH